MPELKTFDIMQFSLDVYAHRTGLKMSRQDYAHELGIESPCPIHHIEIRKVQAPTLVLAMNLCAWMGKNINDYFK